MASGMMELSAGARGVCARSYTPISSQARGPRAPRAAAPRARCAAAAAPAASATSAEGEETAVQAAAAAPTPWIDALAACSEDFPVVADGAAAAALRDASREALRSGSLAQPTRRAESYRFTDYSGLMKATPTPPPAADMASVQAVVDECCQGEGAEDVRLVFVDGVYAAELSRASTAAVPDSALVGALSALEGDDAGAGALSALGMPAGAIRADDERVPDLFPAANGACFTDAAVVALPAGARIDAPVRVLYVSSGAAAGGGGGEAPPEVPIASPRLLVVAGEGAQVTVEEEFVAAGAAAAPGAAYAVNAVSEVVLARGASVTHGVLQRQTDGCFHMHSTRVQQASTSKYAASEVCAGAVVGRHSLGVQQLGEATETEMKTFALAGDGQTQDLHSKLVLDHPKGTAEQLHKVIVYAASGRGVFDGNVRVQKAAQETNAQQLSRSLLLVPRATTNVKPNLQIVADDVKCTHGATISDLEDEEVFYFLSRGIREEEARKALVYSFGAEVVDCLPTEATKKRAREVVASKLKEWAQASSA